MAKITKEKSKAATATAAAVIEHAQPAAAVNYFSLVAAQLAVLQITYKTPEAKKASKAYQMREYIRAGHTDAECIEFGMKSLGMTRGLSKVYALGHRARISKN